MRSALAALFHARVHKALTPFTRGAGLILMLHHVRPASRAAFVPNRMLEITPEFLEEVIAQVRADGFDIVSLDEARRRLTRGGAQRPFTCFTFDDGYRDNLVHAYPIFRRHGLPMAIYVPTDYPDGRGDLWWLALERVVAAVDEVRTAIDGERRVYRCATPAEKQRTFHDVYWWLRGIDEGEARRFVRNLCDQVGIDTAGLCRDLVLSWDDLRHLAKDPLVTIGAHTRSHFALAKLPLAEARREMADSIDRIEQEIGVRPVHFSYPYGCEQSAAAREFELAAELGMATGVTTRKGVLYAGHGRHLTALPRVSLNGDFQDRRFVSVLASGAPFYLWNGMRRVLPA